jgi:four helix bundle protein
VNWYRRDVGMARCSAMHSYRSLEAWKVAHRALLVTLRSIDGTNRPKTWALFDQLKRAAISIEANIVEGYALNTPRYFHKHMRIAFGSAAEAECLVLAAGEVGYLEQAVVKELETAFGDSMRLVFGLMKGRRAKDPTPHALRPTP